MKLHAKLVFFLWIGHAKIKFALKSWETPYGALKAKEMKCYCWQFHYLLMPFIKKPFEIVPLISCYSHVKEIIWNKDENIAKYVRE